jgi:hypothetical protein
MSFGTIEQVEKLRFNPALYQRRGRDGFEVLHVPYPWVEDMTHTWYVTFEVPRRGVFPERRSPRTTRTFGSETEAKRFARSKFHEGMTIYAGTINPHAPKQLISSDGIRSWLEGGNETRSALPDRVQNKQA